VYDEHDDRQDKNDVYKERGDMKGEHRETPRNQEQDSQNSKHEMNPSI
jgi:hypothetical protein